VFDLYYLRRINFTATATTPAAASSGRMPGSGIGTGCAKTAAGNIKKSAVISFCDFIAYPPHALLIRGHGFRAIKLQYSHQLLLGAYESDG